MNSLLNTLIKTPKNKSLYQLISFWVRIRDKKCVLCGSTENLTAGHIYSRRFKSVTFDEMNIFCQCENCNSRHNNPNEKYIYYGWFIRQFGEKAFVDLGKRKKKIKTYSSHEIETLIASYKVRLSKALGIEYNDNTPKFISQVRKAYNVYRGQ